MMDRRMIELNRKAWDTIALGYQADTRISTDDVHYGPLGLGERELGLLGEVAGKRIMEIGCGGGQNSIALAKRGAKVVGTDPSTRQLEYAKRLSRREGLDISFVEAFAEDLDRFQDASFDLAISSYSLGYASDLDRAFREAWRILVPGGHLVFCLTHPWSAAVGWFLMGEKPEIGDYARWPVEDEWEWVCSNGARARMRERLWTLAQIMNMLIDAGFDIERVMEQAFEDIEAPGAAGRLPYLHRIDTGSKEYLIGRKLPGTLLIKARKKPTSNVG